MSEKKVDPVEKRVIEATVLVPFIKAVGEKTGLDAATAIVRQALEEMSRAQGRASARGRGGNHISDLAEVVKGWAAGGALEEEVVEYSETAYSFNVTRCMYAERYRELGIEEFGYCLSCCRHEPFARGL